jgi:hypothetical protein
MVLSQHALPGFARAGSRATKASSASKQAHAVGLAHVLYIHAGWQPRGCNTSSLCEQSMAASFTHLLRMLTCPSAAPAAQVYTCNSCVCQDWYVDVQGRLHPLHAPQLCLDIAGGKTSIATCSSSTTQAFAGLGEYCGVSLLQSCHGVCQGMGGGPCSSINQSIVITRADKRPVGTGQVSLVAQSGHHTRQNAHSTDCTHLAAVNRVL